MYKYSKNVLGFDNMGFSSSIQTISAIDFLQMDINCCKSSFTAYVKLHIGFNLEYGD